MNISKNSSFELLSTMSPKVDKTRKKPQRKKAPTKLALRKPIRRSSFYDKLPPTVKNCDISLVDAVSMDSSSTTSSVTQGNHGPPVFDTLLPCGTVSRHQSTKNWVADISIDDGDAQISVIQGDSGGHFTGLANSTFVNGKDCRLNDNFFGKVTGKTMNYFVEETNRNDDPKKGPEDYINVKASRLFEEAFGRTNNGKNKQKGIVDKLGVPKRGSEDFIISKASRLFEEAFGNTNDNNDNGNNLDSRSLKSIGKTEEKRSRIEHNFIKSSNRNRKIETDSKYKQNTKKKSDRNTEKSNDCETKKSNDQNTQKCKYQKTKKSNDQNVEKSNKGDLNMQQSREVEKNSRRNQIIETRNKDDWDSEMSSRRYKNIEMISDDVNSEKSNRRNQNIEVKSKGDQNSEKCHRRNKKIEMGIQSPHFGSNKDDRKLKVSDKSKETRKVNLKNLQLNGKHDPGNKIDSKNPKKNNRDLRNIDYLNNLNKENDSPNRLDSAFDALKNGIFESPKLIGDKRSRNSESSRNDLIGNRSYIIIDDSCTSSDDSKSIISDSCESNDEEEIDDSSEEKKNGATDQITAELRKLTIEKEKFNSKREDGVQCEASMEDSPVRDGQIVDDSDEEIKTPKRPVGMIEECETLLDELYGQEWRKSKENLFTSEPRIAKHTEKFISKTDVKPKKSMVYKNPYLETESNKSKCLLRTLQVTRMKKALESPWIQQLQSLCDPESDESSSTNSSFKGKIDESPLSRNEFEIAGTPNPRMKLNFDDPDESPYTKYKIDESPRTRKNETFKISKPKTKLNFNDESDDSDDNICDGVVQNRNPKKNRKVDSSNKSLKVSRVTVRKKFAQRKSISDNESISEFDKLIADDKMKNTIEPKMFPNQIMMNNVDVMKNSTQQFFRNVFDDKMKNIETKKSTETVHEKGLPIFTGFLSNKTKNTKVLTDNKSKNNLMSNNDAKTNANGLRLGDKMKPNTDEDLIYKKDVPKSGIKKKPTYKSTVLTSTTTKESDSSFDSDFDIGLTLEEKLKGKTKVDKKIINGEKSPVNTFDEGNIGLTDFPQNVANKVPIYETLTNLEDVFKRIDITATGQTPVLHRPDPPITMAQRPCSFLASLSKTVDPSRCDPSARIFRDGYKTHRDKLVQKLFRLYNEEIFDNKIPADSPIEWSTKMVGTAAFCGCKKITRRTGLIERTVRFVLSVKVLDSADRLRDTLVHEMCHAATWIVNKISDGHGPHWKSWVAKAMKRFPELPPIKRCHDYAIYTKYTYKCTKCFYSFGRHSKSINIEKKRCGICFGQFEVFLNKKTKDGETKCVATPKKEATGFALFVQKNYASYKTRRLKHGDVMKLLGEKYKQRQADEQ